MPLLELKAVTKGFGGQNVLSDIHLNIEDGEFVAIVGYSGAGKTTLISMIAGLQKPDSGTVKLNDKIITGPGPDRGVIFQNYSLLPWLTVFENVMLAVDQVFSSWPVEKRRAQADKFIEMVNLKPAREKLPRDLSGGMRQRVSVARALAMDPQILLLDEPFSALDALTRANLQDELSRIWNDTRKTCVMITNDVDEGILLADRIIPLSAGPGATLGPAVPVNLERPRDRRAMNSNAAFQSIRAGVMDWLLSHGPQKPVSLTKRLVLPDIEPEDLNLPRHPGGRKTPIRRSEIKRETVEIS